MSYIIVVSNFLVKKTLFDAEVGNLAIRPLKLLLCGVQEFPWL